MNGISGVNGGSHYDRMSGMSDMSGIDRRPPPPPRSEDTPMSGIEGQSSAQGFDFASQEAGESSGFDFGSTPPPPPPQDSYNAATDTAATSAEDQMNDMMTALQAMLDNIFSLFSTEDDTSTS